MQAGREAQRWEFYMCGVDDKPASIRFNMLWTPQKAQQAGDTRYLVSAPMTDPGPHGMGSAEEQRRMMALEQPLLRGAWDAGAFFVGRLRSDARWTFAFYGPEGLSEALRPLLEPLQGHLHEAHDPQWGYFFGFLWPEEANWAWISDRRVVDQLMQHGDALHQPRTVDHRAVLPDQASAEAFRDQVTRQGYTLAGLAPLERGRVAVDFNHPSAVTLPVIHPIALQLRDLAKQHGGTYDGWGCALVQPD